MTMPRMGVRSTIAAKPIGVPANGAAARRIASALVLSVATVLALATSAAGATATSTTYDVTTATATPPLLCTDCGPVASYTITYTGDGTCSASCAGFPVDPMDVTLTFSVGRFFPPSPCKMKSGTGTLNVSWPNDPSLPAAEGTFTFKARDSHFADFSGSVITSSLSVLPAGETLGGSVTYPPSPCTGGTAQAEISFGQ
jgi:uncharacterized low-complexity protein